MAAPICGRNHFLHQVERDLSQIFIANDRGGVDSARDDRQSVERNIPDQFAPALEPDVIGYFAFHRSANELRSDFARPRLRRAFTLTEDDQSKDGESATGVKKLISRDKVVAILGEVASGRSMEAAPICQLFKIPQISPSSTNPKVTQTGNYIFRVCFIDPFQGTVMATFADKTLHAKKVALLTDVGSAYSVGLATFFKDSFTKAGGQIVGEQKFTKDDKDFKPARGSA